MDARTMDIARLRAENTLAEWDELFARWYAGGRQWRSSAMGAITPQLGDLNEADVLQSLLGRPEQELPEAMEYPTPISSEETGELPLFPVQS